MTPDSHTLDREAAALRRAVSHNDFAAAELSARRYTSLVESGLPGLEAAEAEVRLRQACDLVEWARRNLCAARARIARGLQQLQGISRYHAAAPAASAPPATWKIDA